MMLRLEPRRIIPYTLVELPTLWNDRIDNELPSCTEDKADKQDPSFAVLNRVNVLPKRVYDCTESEEAINT
jgi:hypothetical protein